MKGKRLVSLVLAGVMALSMIGCGNAAPAGSGSSGKGSDGKINLTMWCIATESDSNRHSYVQAIEDMQKKYPDINFTWEAFENQSYKTKIKAAVSANEMPDIFFTWSCAFLGDFVDAGKVYCLDDAYQNYKSELPEVMMGNSTYN